MLSFEIESFYVLATGATNFPSDELLITDEDINEILIQEGILEESTTHQQTNNASNMYNIETTTTSANLLQDQLVEPYSSQEFYDREITGPLIYFESDISSSEQGLNSYSPDSTSKHRISNQVLQRENISGIQNFTIEIDMF